MLNSHSGPAPEERSSSIFEELNHGSHGIEDEWHQKEEGVLVAAA
jgi:hypothetical protein